MKKLILVLAILLAVPAFALNIALVKQTPDGNKVDLNYAGADGNNLPRAFALKIVVNSPAKIANVTNFKTGESTQASPGYGIYPATIIIDSNDGSVDNNGTPLAAPGDPGAETGLGTNKIVLEFGSLYAPVAVGSPNAPAATGTLCTLTMDCNGATGDVNIVATEEDIYRGGVVLENGTAPDPNLSATLAYTCSVIVPCPGQASNPNPTNGAINVARSTNLSWNAGSDANSHRIYFGPNSVSEMVFAAEQSGTTYDPCTTGAGNLGQGKKYYWRIDEKNSCGTTTGPVWDFNTQGCYNDPCVARQNAWVQFGRPDCWCYQRQCRGDADGLIQLSAFWVYTYDLAILRAGYMKTDVQLMTIVSNGKPGICGDACRDKQLATFRVYTYDLARLRQYYMKTVGSIPVCDSNVVNFWMN